MNLNTGVFSESPIMLSIKKLYELRNKSHYKLRNKVLVSFNLSNRAPVEIMFIGSRHVEAVTQPFRSSSNYGTGKKQKTKSNNNKNCSNQVN